MWVLFAHESNELINMNINKIHISICRLMIEWEMMVEVVSLKNSQT